MPQASRPQYRVLVEKDVPMQTRDGVTLRADVYRPDTAGRFPVLLSRLPYNKNLRPPHCEARIVLENGKTDTAYSRLNILKGGKAQDWLEPCFTSVNDTVMQDGCVEHRPQKER